MGDNLVIMEAIPIINQFWGEPINLKVVLYNRPQIKKKISNIFMMGEWTTKIVHVEYVATTMFQKMFCKQSLWKRIT